MKINRGLLMKAVAAGKMVSTASRHLKAARAFDENVKVYGSRWHALKALDCIDREEAIKMLSAVQTVHVFKCEGRIVIN